jgi:ATP-dependent RNA helicase HelY
VHLAGLASKRLYPLRSSFTPTYNMAVNLVAQVGAARAREVLETSFAQYQADRAVVAQVRTLRDTTTALEAATAALTCHRGDILGYDALRQELAEIERAASARRGPKDRRRSQADEKHIADLRRRLRAHPCHRCPELSNHIRQGAQRARLAAQRDTLTRRIATRAGTVAARFDTVCQVLVRLGYMTDDDELRPTPDGEWLRRIYTENDLVTAQCLRSGALSGLDAAALAGAVSALVYRSRRDEPREPRIPEGPLTRALDGITHAWQTVADAERPNGLPPTPPLDLGLVEAVHRWARGQGLSNVLRSAGLDAGDFVRWARQVIDLLGQLSHAAPDPAVRTTARHAAHALRRGVVAADTV